MTEIAPPEWAIKLALEAARRSPCRSKRGVVVYWHDTRGATRQLNTIYGTGHNGPPAGFGCPGREHCTGNCGRRCVHAEMRALRGLRSEWMCGAVIDLVHVELAVAGGMVACDGPRCLQCSSSIVDVGFVAGVWLYEATPEEWCPHLDQPCVDCPLCQGEDCDMCHPGPGRPRCVHDVLDRHYGHPIIEARWRRYNASDFHLATLHNNRLVP